MSKAKRQGEAGAELLPVHGGLEAPVSCFVPLCDRAQLEGEAAACASIQVRPGDMSVLQRMADGTLSPLQGPMREAVFRRALEEQVLRSKGEDYAWPIPMALPLSKEEAAPLRTGGTAALRGETGALLALLDDIEVFEFDKAFYVERVYGTRRFDHPGGRMVEEDPRPLLIGGALRALPAAKHPEYGAYLLSPLETRARIRARGWRRALAFQTRNPLHRAHEYALVAGAERLTAEGHFTGVVLNPLVGELKGDDVPALTRMRCYRELLERGLLGKGDIDEAVWRRAGYTLQEVFDLVALDMKMFYGGPSEALMHAVYRQNHGFSDLVIGRKHADAPFEDGEAIWGDFDAQDIFERPPGILHIRPCKIGFAAFYESMGRVDLVERHPDEKPYSISGTRVREQLGSGERPDPRILRPEIADILIEAYRG